MDYSAWTDFPVHHQLLEFAQTHVHRISDAIQPSYPLLSPSSPAFNLSQHQGLFTWVSSLHLVAKVLELQLQHQSFQWIFRTDFLYDWLVGSPCCPRDSQESSPTPQFKSINSSVLSFLYSSTHTSILDHWKNHIRSWMSSISSPQPFWHQRLISWKTILSMNRGWQGMVWGWLKCITFIVHFISNLMLSLIWAEVPVCGLQVGDPCSNPHLPFVSSTSALPLGTVTVVKIWNHFVSFHTYAKSMVNGQLVHSPSTNFSIQFHVWVQFVLPPSYLMYKFTIVTSQSHFQIVLNFKYWTCKQQGTGV